MSAPSTFMQWPLSPIEKNVISHLKDESGNLIADHESKAALIWHAFKNRLGVSSNPTMLFDLPELITPQNLEALVHPFTRDEIDSVIKCLPGPDGFNGMFIKKCWSEIKEDFYQLLPRFL